MKRTTKGYSQVLFLQNEVPTPVTRYFAERRSAERYFAPDILQTDTLHPTFRTEQVSHPAIRS